MVFGDYRCATLERDTDCTSSVTTTVWDGNAVLLERRAVGDSGYVASSTGDRYGDVAYVHGLELDRPFVILKTGTHDVLPLTRTSDDKFIAGVCPDTVCSSSDVDFPMARTWIHGGAPPAWATGTNWYGAQITGMVDGSGYVYQRNRYLDPNTGLFTQQDPIGLAGGMNTYGFTGGDPVNYADPLGLCAGPSDLKCPDNGRGPGVLGTMLAGIGSVFQKGIDNLIGSIKSGEFAQNAVFGIIGSIGASGPEAVGVGTNPFLGPVESRVFIADPHGNVIPVEAGQNVTGSPTGSPKGSFLQVRADGTATGMRLDGPHGAGSHPDPRAQLPHAHVPGVTNADGTPWLPVKP